MEEDKSEITTTKEKVRMMIDLAIRIQIIGKKETTPMTTIDSNMGIETTTKETGDSMTPSVRSLVSS